MILVFFLCTFFVYSLFILYYSKNWSRELFITLSFCRDFAYEGEETILIEKIENKKKLPVPILELGFQLQKGLTFRQMENAQVSDFLYKRDIFSLLGFQRITRNLLVDCNHRGYYFISDLQCIGYSLLIKHKYIVNLQSNTDFYVYSKRTDVSDILLSYNQMMGSRQVTKQLYEDPFAFHAIREYTLNDPMKSINWKASAKTGNLMVNTFDSTLTGKVMIYLDVNERRMMRQDFLIEEAISITASLTYKFIHQGMNVGLAINMPVISDNKEKQKYFYVAPAIGTSHMTKIERALAKIDLTKQMLDYEEILQNKIEDGVSIFITKNEALLSSISNFCGKNTPAILVFLVDSNEKIPIFPQKNNLAIIRREGNKH